MIANGYNVLLGLALVYIAVLQPSIAERRPVLLLIAAVTMFVAALVARRSDHHPWQNNVNLVLAALLGAASALRLQHAPQAAFWSLFFLALWAALYRPTSPSSGG